jgi:hypothetical protein
MIYVFSNYEKGFKRNALVKNRVLGFACNMKFRIIGSREFSEVVCKNLFGTTSSLIQFKSAPVSNKTIVSSLKSFEKTRVILIKYFFEDI